jgi:hypothetical protein
VGFLLGAPITRALDKVQLRMVLAATLTAAAAGYLALFTAPGLAVALPAAVAIGMCGSMSATIPLTVVQRWCPTPSWVACARCS